MNFESDWIEPGAGPEIDYPHVWQEFDNHSFNMSVALEDDGVVAYAYFHRIYEGQDVGLFKTMWLYNVVEETQGISQSIRSYNFVPPRCEPIKQEYRISDNFPATIFGVWLPGGEVECAIIYNGSRFLGCSLDDPLICYTAQSFETSIPFIQPLTAEIAEQFNHEMILHIANNNLTLPEQFNSILSKLQSK